MKKLSCFATFFAGILVGAIPYVLTLTWHTSPTAIETSIAEMLYDDLQPYVNDYRLDTVLQLLKEQASKKRTPISNAEIYPPLIDLALKHSEKAATEALAQAEQFLKILSTKEHILPIVENRIYIEILEEGSGEIVSPQDVINIHFKEFSLDGTILKDTTSIKPFTIPLSQTIKGFQLGMQGAKIGERRKIYLHPEFGFDKLGQNDLLIYEISVISKK
ncbi:MAG TPA: FKBP-type peptidyl-prolyl cis-trans isomerase [Rhabdochlamydiaceae bacterium]|nr:FKBP-type peptidyl-prolyl cis-trans isomerase [Rhabdochlamydiaceae bacterium]